MEIASTADEVARRLVDLETRLRDELGSCAQVKRSSLSDGRISMVSMAPESPGALGVNWMEMQGELILTAGHEGGRWELDWSQSAVEFVEEVVWSVVEGRAREVFAPMRSHVQVTLADGRVVATGGYDGCFTMVTPIPGWRRFGRKVQYSRYQ